MDAKRNVRKGKLILGTLVFSPKTDDFKPVICIFRYIV